MELNPPNLFDDMKKRTENGLKKLPEALSKQKKKFLIAINKCDEQEFNKEDEEFVKKVMADLNPIPLALFGRGVSLPWHDSVADTFVKSSLEKNTFFELNKYLNCAILVFKIYSGIDVFNVGAEAEYVLRHARRFGDTSKTIFQTNDDVTNAQPDKQYQGGVSTTTSLPESKFMNKIKQLIADLNSVYDETKYIILNLNTTYITLLMLRRLVKNEVECAAAFQRIHTHDNYVKLCPWPLDNQLPKCRTKCLADFTLRSCAFLAIQAYLDTDDEKTKRVLRVTCVQYMEWNGLQLPNLFFKVVELYETDAGKLWDLLCVTKCTDSLMLLANAYYEKYQSLKDDPTKTQRWFPYCRTINGDFHTNLSASANNVICLNLAYLIDLKIGFDRSTVRLSHWAKSCLWKDSCQKFAEKIHQKLISQD